MFHEETFAAGKKMVEATVNSVLGNAKELAGIAPDQPGAALGGTETTIDVLSLWQFKPGSFNPILRSPPSSMREVSFKDTSTRSSPLLTSLIKNQQKNSQTITTLRGIVAHADFAPTAGVLGTALGIAQQIGAAVGITDSLNVFWVYIPLLHYSQLGTIIGLTGEPLIIGYKSALTRVETGAGSNIQKGTKVIITASDSDWSRAELVDTFSDKGAAFKNLEERLSAKASFGACQVPAAKPTVVSPSSKPVYQPQFNVGYVQLIYALAWWQLKTEGNLTVTEILFPFTSAPPISSPVDAASAAAQASKTKMMESIKQLVTTNAKIADGVDSTQGDNALKNWVLLSSKMLTSESVLKYVSPAAASNLANEGRVTVSVSSTKKANLDDLINMFQSYTQGYKIEKHFVGTGTQSNSAQLNFTFVGPSSAKSISTNEAIQITARNLVKFKAKLNEKVLKEIKKPPPSTTAPGLQRTACGVTGQLATRAQQCKSVKGRQQRLICTFGGGNFPPQPIRKDPKTRAVHLPEGWAQANIVRRKFTMANGQTKSIRLHRDIADQFVATFEKASKASGYSPKSIAGFVPRVVTKDHDAGYSNHSLGVCVDFDPGPNRRPPPGDGKGLIYLEYPKFAEIFKADGWMWGGDWRRRDDMHFVYKV